MNNQKQSGGNNSTNIQAESITLVQGVSYTEVKDIALQVFKSNFYELAGEAKQIARTRAEEITEQFLQKLKAQNEVGFKQAQDPDFQNALFTVQKQYARSGDKELGDLLVDILVDRTKHGQRSILQIVLNESLEVAPKLTEDHLAALSAAFLMKYVVNKAINGMESLEEYLDRYLQPLVPHIPVRTAAYQHIEYSGCANIGLARQNLAAAFYALYSGLFSKGFVVAELTNQSINVSSDSGLVRPCLNDSEKIQLNAINEEVFRDLASKKGVQGGDIDKLVALENSNRMGDKEIQDYLIKRRGYMEVLFKSWNDTPIGQLTLTSVGIAIAHANLKRRVGQFTDLSIWIN
jgi:hypothetical protein